MSSTTTQGTTTRKNRITLILTLVAFVLPVALAYLVHATGFWQQRGTVNEGHFINPPVIIDEFTFQTEPNSPVFDRKTQWWIAYTAPNQCETACINSLFQIRQSQVATGPDKKRVSTLFIHHEKSDPKALTWVKENSPQMAMTQVTESQWNALMSQAPLNPNVSASNAGQIYLVDPMGAIFMTYPAIEDEKASIQQGKGIVKDLKRVLKLSRIG